MPRYMKELLLLLLVLALITCARKPSYQEAPVTGNEIRLMISNLPEEKPVFYSFKYEDVNINYFVFREKDRVESYFDACLKCYAKEQGYSSANGELLCRACSQQFPLEKIKGVGSCCPLPLDGRIEGDMYIISTKDIVKGVQYF